MDSNHELDKIFKARKLLILKVAEVTKSVKNRVLVQKVYKNIFPQTHPLTADRRSAIGCDGLRPLSAFSPGLKPASLKPNVGGRLLGRVPINRMTENGGNRATAQGRSRFALALESGDGIRYHWPHG
jgi:hypothetical protein